MCSYPSLELFVMWYRKNVYKWNTLQLFFLCLLHHSSQCTQEPLNTCNLPHLEVYLSHLQYCPRCSDILRWKLFFLAHSFREQWIVQQPLKTNWMTLESSLAVLGTQLLRQAQNSFTHPLFYFLLIPHLCSMHTLSSKCHSKTDI